MRYRLTRDGVGLSYSDVLDLWQADAQFRDYYTGLLAASPFSAFRWETPAVTSSTSDQLFQFVLLDTPRFSTRSTDRKTFEDYFTSDDTDSGIVSFMSLGGDAQLIVPSPRTEISAYGHLAAFLRQAPQRQLDAFWRVVSTAVQSRIGEKPLWLNTAGGGVAWLHVRLDSRPKYYGYAPYKDP
jgi:hypothetical protein